MRGDELAPVVLEDVVVGAARAKRLAEEHQVRYPGDELFDGRSLHVEDPGLGLPQQGGHVRSVIGSDQEMVKRAKTFSELLLS